MSIVATPSLARLLHLNVITVTEKNFAYKKTSKLTFYKTFDICISKENQPLQNCILSFKKNYIYLNVCIYYALCNNSIYL